MPDLGFLAFLNSALGIAAAILAGIAFWRKQIKYRAWLILLSLALGVIATMLVYAAKERESAEKIARIAKDALKKDAAIVSSAIVISGLEDPGEYVGYLSQIAGFYRRHEKDYRSESEVYVRQLNEWQDHLREARRSGALVELQNVNRLRGIVSAGREHLRVIANSP